MESNASLTRSLSKVKSKISSKFRADSVTQDDEDGLKAMKYDDTAPSTTSLSSLISPSTNSLQPSSSLPSATLTTSTSSTSLASATTPSLRQSSVQESRSSSVVLMESIPETLVVVNGCCTHQRSASQSTNQSEAPSQLFTSLSTDHLMSLQSSRKTSVEENKDDSLLEQLLPPPPVIDSTSQITTEFSSPFGRLSPPISPISNKLRNSSVVCDPLENIATVLQNRLSSIPAEPLTSANDFADAMALSILDKVDGNTDSNSDWKI